MKIAIKQNLLEALSIEVTTRCNLHCSHCFALAGISQKKDMEYTIAQDIVREGFKSGFRILHLTGGETFLWKPVFDLIDFAFELGYNQIVINTNAMLLTGKICKKLAQYNKRNDKKIDLTCSMNGDKNLHESIRGQDTYAKACAGIEKALDHNINVNIFTTVEKKLLADLPVFTDTLFKRFSGIKNLFFIQLRNIETGGSFLSERMLSPREFVTLVRFMGFLRLQGHPVNILENPLADVVANVLNMNWLPKSPNITRYGKITVLCDGNITANHSSRESYGTYSPGKLEEILTSPRYLEDTGLNKDICPLCEFHETCQSKGMNHPSSKYHNNTMDDVPFCKKVLQDLQKSGITDNEVEVAKNFVKE